MKFRLCSFRKGFVLPLEITFKIRLFCPFPVLILPSVVFSFFLGLVVGIPAVVIILLLMFLLLRVTILCKSIVFLRKIAFSLTIRIHIFKLQILLLCGRIFTVSQSVLLLILFFISAFCWLPRLLDILSKGFRLFLFLNISGSIICISWLMFPGMLMLCFLRSDSLLGTTFSKSTLIPCELSRLVFFILWH